VREVLILSGITPMPGVKHWVMGVANVHDRPTAIIDLKGFLALTDSDATPNLNAAIILDNDGIRSGLVVDEIQGRKKLSRDTQHTTLPNEVPHTLVPFSDGHFEDSERYIVFDSDKLIHSEQFLAVTSE